MLRSPSRPSTVREWLPVPPPSTSTSGGFTSARAGAKTPPAAFFSGHAFRFRDPRMNELSRDDRPPWGARSRPRASDFPRNTEHDADLSFLTPIRSLQVTPSAIATSPSARTRRPPSPPPPRAAATGEPPSATPPPPTAPAATSATSRGRPTRSPSSVSVHSIPPTRAARVEPAP